MTGAADPSGRFARLSALLAQDPGNLPLLADTAEAAFAEGQFGEAEALLGRHAEIAPLSPEVRNLAGLAAMRLLRWEDAAAQFAALMTDGADDPAIRFNRAWTLAMAQRFGEALPLLDEATADALPQAAQLEVQLLHELGDYDRASLRSRTLIERHPEHSGLNAVVSMLAIDIEDNELALRTARQAGDHPNALATLGTLALDGDDVEAAALLFDAALARSPDAPRARIGRGLVHMLAGDKALAAQDLDAGAARFGTHLGSWIAAGWAHLIAGDLGLARARFEKALALDDSFGEAQGSLAVIEIYEGRIDEAAQRLKVARRLDPKAFSVAFASMLLAAGAGDADKARAIFEAVLHAPMNAEGRTLAQSLARLGRA
jgi:tetratricopeptide (TPR) repeat protein